ncbi:hypothetical protein DQ04_12581020 [Trypanosoma grayi]|uniref:hypothetical protein n=1 Tax=Trypanosoma grayi TaxID=71804 RepID=UPI0004F42763|nr:hypothetical protein DQ04_12581020 [Trypanosoma grayi]KEG06720.1 hypothetical protein DQ04_12581020 [Trypanosoma grayi]
MDASNELVASVVRMQLSSPNFAEYCVAHVTDPKHRFLFAKDESAERLQYTRLLAKHQQQESSNAGAAAAGPHSTSSLGCGSNAAAALWASLLDYFASARNVRGPHMPHMFRTEKDLAEFVELLNGAQSDGACREGVVQHMLRRLPMTETFLYVLCFLCDTQVQEAHRAARLRGDAAAAAAVDDATLQSAGTLLFIANMLLAEHEALSRPLRYKAAFAAYELRMVAVLAAAAPRDSQVAVFLRETVSVWAACATFDAETLLQMKQATGCA